MDTLFVALALILAGGVAGLCLARQFTFMKLVTIATTSVGCGIGLVFTLPRLLSGVAVPAVSYRWLHIFTLSFNVDSIALFFLLPIFLISPLALLYSFNYLENREKKIRVGVNYFFFAVLVASMALVVMATNMITFILAWEVMSLSSFFLVIYDYQVKANRQAGYLYFIFAQGGAMFIFAAFALVYSHSASFDFAGFAAIDDFTKLIAFLLILIGCGSKAGILPLHIWLPYAHPAAPSHVSAVMSGVMIKIGIYGIVRFYLLLAPTAVIFGQITIALGILSGILGVVYALGQHDIKRLLAYHSVENIGIILLGLGVGMLGAASGNKTMAAFGFAGGLLHVLNHSLFKSLLFMGAGAVIQQTGTAMIDRLGGLLKKMPLTGKCFLVGSISISGLPPFNGFISEFLIYYGAFYGLSLSGVSFIFSALVIISLAIIGGLAATCFSKVVGIVFLGEPRDVSVPSASEAGSSMVLAQVVLAVTCFVIGVWPDYLVRAAFHASRAIPVIADFEVTRVMPIMVNVSRTAALFLFLLVVVTVVRKLFYVAKDSSQAGTWGCGFTQPTVRMQYTGTSYADSVLDFFRPFVKIQKKYAGINNIFPEGVSYDTHTEDIFASGLNRFIARPITSLLERLHWIQHGNIHLYIGYIVLTIMVLLCFL
ncbi:MAG: hydrogenase [Deltaproteobacteria bacterium]|nr:hydrogenase [Candidatus Tharpella aukensis]